jgi:hypothetical protein
MDLTPLPCASTARVTQLPQLPREWKCWQWPQLYIWRTCYSCISY